MANVLKDEKKQQIIALGRLGWSLRKIQEATRVRRETISAYLKGAGVEIWPPGRWRRESKAKPAIEAITGSGAAKPAIPGSAGLLTFDPNWSQTTDSRVAIKAFGASRTSCAEHQYHRRER
jgi:hypothetical protein